MTVRITTHLKRKTPIIIRTDGYKTMVESLYRKKRNVFLGRSNWHSMAEIYLMDRLLYKNKFNRIIELGTMAGGMTLIFGIHALKMGADVKTFDIRAEPKDVVWKNLMKALPITHHAVDVFGDEAHELIKNYMREGRVLLYCDNGKKIDEFNTYSKYLKSGDIVMTHDRPGEIKLSDIEESVVKYNLKPMYGLELLTYGASEMCFIRGDDSD